MARGGRTKSTAKRTGAKAKKARKATTKVKATTAKAGKAAAKKAKAAAGPARKKAAIATPSTPPRTRAPSSPPQYAAPGPAAWATPAALTFASGLEPIVKTSDALSDRGQRPLPRGHVHGGHQDRHRQAIANCRA